VREEMSSNKEEKQGRIVQTNVILALMVWLKHILAVHFVETNIENYLDE
jgi:hypothetical protein